MPTLRDQVLAYPETVSAMAVSAEDRYRDGGRLLDGGRYCGAVYILGLAAEMWLKLASFRLVGARASDPVGPHAQQVARFMTANAPTVSKESGHSLLYWAEFIVLFGRGHGMPLTAEQVGRIRHHVAHRAYLDWKIEIRYRPVPVSAAAAQRVFADVGWVRSHWAAVGR